MNAPALDARRIARSVDGHLLIDGIDCTAPAGTVTALIGPNGAGKSTLLHTLAGIDRPSTGTVGVGEDDIFRMPRRTRARLLTLVEQDAGTDLELTVDAVVSLGRIPHHGLWTAETARDREAVCSALERVGMMEFADRLFSSLSGGERQRVQLARALAQEPAVLLLDEPTNHLDIRAQLAALELLETLANDGMTVLAALHDLGLAASYSERVIVLRQGRVVAAGPTHTVLTAELIRTVYEVEAVVLEHPLTGRPLVAVDSVRKRSGEFAR
ncbi:ABC transporter ATP-binding protein [Luethyella okanaganae]|uniref:ABC transporter ATP-binding protein n=1 Tax=Luethyella okanaganae TaxID=69372 RepID=A0ABW1VKS4_9MICO